MNNAPEITPSKKGGSISGDSFKISVRNLFGGGEDLTFIPETKMEPDTRYTLVVAEDQQSGSLRDEEGNHFCDVKRDTSQET
jgi:hypothetical protein